MSCIIAFVLLITGQQLAVHLDDAPSAACTAKAGVFAQSLLDDPEVAEFVVVCVPQGDKV